MACNWPVQAYQTDAGEIVFSDRGAHRPLTLSCGKCMGCRVNRAQAWAVRVANEAAMHDSNSYITLTYDNEHLPPYGQLEYKDWQLFAKKLRRKKGPFRFYMCGEYGDKDKRPHFHAALFGLDWDDREPIRTSGEFTLYRSQELEDLWGKGMTSTGSVTFTSAGYIARYITKKLYGQRAKEHYQRMDLTTGEVITLNPEFTRMSLRPGIGSTWIEKYWKEVVTHDGVHLNERKYKTPKFYDRKIREIDGFSADDIAHDRSIRARNSDPNEHTERRREDKETVLAARMRLRNREE